MYSPLEAVRGHDATFVRRMSVAEYAAELRNEAAVATATRVQRGDDSRRRSSNRSDDDGAVDDDDGEGVVSRSDVTFTCRFPLRDRLGRQLCVLYQVQDTAVADELRRLRSEANVAATSSSRTTAAAAADEPVGRRSGVRLSNELDVAYTAGGNEDNSSGGGVPWRCAAGGRGDVARKRQRRASSSSSLTNNTDDDDDSVSCASTSLVMDSGNDMHSSQGAHALLVGGDVCDYTLYRDSDGAQSSSVRGTTQHNNSNNSNSSHNVLVDRLHAALSRAHSAPLQRGSRLGTPRDATTTTTTTTTACAHTTDDKENATHDSVTNTASTTNAAAVAASSLRCASAPRVHRVYFADDAAVQQRRSATCTRQSPLPVVTTTGHAHNNNNNHNTSVAAAAAAVTPAIGSSSYGADAATIAAHKVHALMEQQWCTRYGMCNNNTVSSRRRVKDEDEASDNSARTQGHDAACTSAPALPPYGCIVDCRDTPAPELCCGSVVTLGCAGVGQQQQHEEGKEQQEQQQQDEDDVRSYRRRYALQHFCAAAEVYVATDVTARPDEHDSDTTSATAATATATTTTTSARQVLLYRWHTTSQSRLETKETWRAAAGIAACMPVVASRGGGNDSDKSDKSNSKNNNNTTTTAAASLPPTAVHVHGYCYADGVGVTVLVLPPSYKAVCVGAVSLLLEATSYATLLKMTTRALAALVARRLVHGRLDCLDVLFLALPSTMTATATTTTATTPTTAATMTPLLLPVHWERCVDFSMFVDRDAGRTLPYDSEDLLSSASSSSSSLLTIGSDVLTLLPCLLQHRLSRELTAQQHTLLHRLTVMAAEATTHVADMLLHMTRLMHALPSNTAASLSAAVDHIRAAMMV